MFYWNEHFTWNPIWSLQDLEGKDKWHLVVRMFWIYQGGKGKHEKTLISLYGSWVCCFVFCEQVVWEIKWICSAGLDVWGGAVKEGGWGFSVTKDIIVVFVLKYSLPYLLELEKNIQSNSVSRQWLFLRQEPYGICIQDCLLCGISGKQSTLPMRWLPKSWNSSEGQNLFVMVFCFSILQRTRGGHEGMASFQALFTVGLPYLIYYHSSVSSHTLSPV